jgi:hypothetical protein
MLLEELPEHEVALVAVHCSFTPWPKLMEVACDGEVKLTEGIGSGMGMGMGIGIGEP